MVRTKQLRKSTPTTPTVLPSPHGQKKKTMWAKPDTPKRKYRFRGKVTANMDPKHRTLEGIYDAREESGDLTIIVHTKFGDVQTKVHSLFFTPFFNENCDTGQTITKDTKILNLTDTIAPAAGFGKEQSEFEAVRNLTDLRCYRYAVNGFLKIPYALASSRDCFRGCGIFEAYCVVKAFGYKHHQESFHAVVDRCLPQDGSSADALFKFIREHWDFFLADEQHRTEFMETFGERVRNGHSVGFVKNCASYQAIKTRIRDGAQTPKDLQIMMMINDIFYEQKIETCDECDLKYIGHHRCDDW